MPTAYSPTRKMCVDALFFLWCAPLTHLTTARSRRWAHLHVRCGARESVLPLLRSMEVLPSPLLEGLYLVTLFGLGPSLLALPVSSCSECRATW